MRKGDGRAFSGVLWSQRAELICLFGISFLLPTEAQAKAFSGCGHRRKEAAEERKTLSA